MKGILLFKVLFTLIGAGTLAGSIFLFSDTREFLGEAVKGEGEVIELVAKRSTDSNNHTSYTYAPRVRFRSGGGHEFEFTASISSNPPSYSVGEIVPLLYQPGDPQKARIDSFFSLWGGALITGVVGLFFFAIGGGMVLYGWRKARKRQWLMTEGTPVQAQIQGVERNTSYKVNGRSPWYIAAQWQHPTSGKVHIFESDNIWFDPEPYLGGVTVTVYIDRNDPGTYHMDTTFLPQRA